MDAADLVDGAGRCARRVGPAPLGSAATAAVALEPVVIALKRGFTQCCLDFLEILHWMVSREG